MQSLGVKYRPRTLEDISGQDTCIQILKQQIETNKIENCLLFCGPSGVGKTTTARAFAYKINEYIDINGNVCSSNPIELDAASNNGVDSVREIIKNASERSLDGKYKVLIIDECHALSNQAWQAFLKCIEEPPTYTIFIFCTTDPQKIPPTIMNRLMKFTFSKISCETIKERLLYICKEEGFTNYQESCDYISKISFGQLRDAVANLEKCSLYNKDITIENTLKILNSYSYDDFFKLINSMIDNDVPSIISLCDHYYNSGFDIKIFLNSFFDFLVDIEKYIVFKDINVTKIPATYIGEIDRSIGIQNALSYYMYLTNNLLDFKYKIKYDSNVYNTVLVTLIKLSNCQ